MILNSMAANEFIEFQFSQQEQFDRIQTIWHALGEAKRTGNWQDDQFWAGFLDSYSSVNLRENTPSEIALGCYGLITGKIKMRRGKIKTRQDDPIAFWLGIGIAFTTGVVTLFLHYRN